MMQVDALCRQQYQERHQVDKENVGRIAVVADGRTS